MHQQSKSCDADCQSVARRPPASKEGEMVALSQIAIKGDIVTPSEVICENGEIVVITRDEKTAPPIIARLQKRHCIYWRCQAVAEDDLFFIATKNFSIHG